MEIDYNLIYYLIWEKMLRKIIISSDHNTVNNIINKFKKTDYNSNANKTLK